MKAPPKTAERRLRLVAPAEPDAESEKTLLEDVRDTAVGRAYGVRSATYVGGVLHVQLGKEPRS